LYRDKSVKINYAEDVIMPFTLNCHRSQTHNPCYWSAYQNWFVDWYYLVETSATDKLHKEKALTLMLPFGDSECKRHLVKQPKGTFSHLRTRSSRSRSFRSKVVAL